MPLKSPHDRYIAELQHLDSEEIEQILEKVPAMDRMTGVWMNLHPTPTPVESGPQEREVARDVPDSDDVHPHATEQLVRGNPRLERYRER
jgi:hypothetical protein